jgi:hypothetical protein
MLMLLILAQAATAAAPDLSAQSAPDIALHATIDAKSVRIVQRGQARLAVHATPDAGSQVNIAVPKANGASILRDVHLTIDAAARIGGGNPPGAEKTGQDPAQETATQQPR